MDIKQSFFTAIRNLYANKLRFAQVMLCMVVGVAGVVLTLCVSNSLLNLGILVDEEYSSTTFIMDVMTNTDLSKRITPNDMEQVGVDNPDIIKAVSPFVYFDIGGGVIYGDKKPETAYLYGVGEQYIDMQPVLHLAEGRFLQTMDISREQRVCVVGNGLANELIGGDALGKELKIWGETYTVVGVLQSVPKLDDYDWSIYFPYPNAKKMVGQETTPFYYNNGNSTMYVDRYFVEANGEENMYNSILTVEDMIEKRMGMEAMGAWYFWPTAVGSINGNIKNAILAGTYQFMVGAIIVLIVGGVGIMNVMQAVVQERTKEIGIRKAFGATNKDIYRQFRLEAIIISLLAGLIGTVLGLIASYIACALAVPVSLGHGIYYTLGLDYLDLPIVPILVAVGASVLVGVIFGTYPAQQAAKMEVVAAINSD